MKVWIGLPLSYRFVVAFSSWKRNQFTLLSMVKFKENGSRNIEDT